MVVLTMCAVEAVKYALQVLVIIVKPLEHTSKKLKKIEKFSKKFKNTIDKHSISCYNSIRK